MRKPIKVISPNNISVPISPQHSLGLYVFLHPIQVLCDWVSNREISEFLASQSVYSVYHNFAVSISLNLWRSLCFLDFLSGCLFHDLSMFICVYVHIYKYKYVCIYHSISFSFEPSLPVSTSLYSLSLSFSHTHTQTIIPLTHTTHTHTQITHPPSHTPGRTLYTYKIRNRKS